MIYSLEFFILSYRKFAWDSGTRASFMPWIIRVGHKIFANDEMQMSPWGLSANEKNRSIQLFQMVCNPSFPYTATENGEWYELMHQFFNKFLCTKPLVIYTTKFQLSDERFVWRMLAQYVTTKIYKIGLHRRNFEWVTKVLRQIVCLRSLHCTKRCLIQYSIFLR